MDFDSLWNCYMGRDVTPAQYAAEGWSMVRILSDLRVLWLHHPTERLADTELLKIADRIAAGFEERGLGPTAPPAEEVEPMDVDAVTLTTHHGAPVAVINGIAYGPEDMTPPGMPAAHLVTNWVGRFIAPLAPEVRALLVSDAAPLAPLAPAMLDLLRRLLAAYDDRRITPPDTFASCWDEVRELVNQAGEVKP